MNQVGPDGKGESIWLGWFLITTLRRFAQNICRKIKNDETTALEFLNQADRYAVAVNKSAWDGDWYIRGFYDNGNALGSARSGVHEAIIDSLAQTWSVISGAADPPERAHQALSSVDKYLVDENVRIIKLLTPPFGSDPNATDNPGYIAGYVPGVRENGAQYTHAATWVVMAHAMLGRGDRAFHLHSMLNPFSHALTQEDAERYRVEPYVVCADVYSAELHSGRGGWTWYTGSSGWMYTTGVSHILGFSVLPNGLVINPCIPSKWEKFEITYKRYDSKKSREYPIQVYSIQVVNPKHVSSKVQKIQKVSPKGMVEYDVICKGGFPFIPFVEELDEFLLDGIHEEGKSNGNICENVEIETEYLYYYVYLG
jgi:cyclic beta-1,2-glucan synthetase